MPERASKNLISNLKKQKRENKFLLFLDNPKIIYEAVNAGLKLSMVLKTNGSDFSENLAPTYLIDEKTLNLLCDVKTPQGVLGVTEYSQDVVVCPKENFLVLDGVQDAGNVGTLLRSAYGAGYNDVYLIGSAHPYNMKVIRSSSGTVFKLNVMEMTNSEFVLFAKKHDLNLVKADMNGVNVFECKLNSQFGIVVGNEGNGVSPEVSALCNKSVSIPMQEGLESLNAGVSGSILMYVLKNQ